MMPTSNTEEYPLPMPGERAQSIDNNDDFPAEMFHSCKDLQSSLALSQSGAVTEPGKSVSAQSAFGDTTNPITETRRTDVAQKKEEDRMSSSDSDMQPARIITIDNKISPEERKNDDFS